MKEEMKQSGQRIASSKQKRIYRWAAACACTLALLLAVPAFLAAAKPIEGTVTQDGATYTYKVEEGEATITHIAKAEDNTAETYEAVIPESITVDGKSYLVVALADNVIGTKYINGSDSNSADTEVSDSALTRVVVPSKLLSIGDQAFAECLALATVEFAADDSGAQHLQSVGSYSFYKSAATNLQLPDTLTTVGDYAFASMTNLQTVKLPATRTEWAKAPFYGSKYMQEFIIPEGAVTVPGVTYEGESVAIPSTVEGEVKITAENATQVDISPNASITTLNLKFGSCDKLAVPDTVTELGLSGTCSEVVFPKNVQVVSLFKITGYEDVVLPATVKTIAQIAFLGNNSIKTLSFEEGSCLEKIDFHAFYSCANLESVQLPEGLTKLNLSAFEKCPSLKELRVPASVSDLSGRVKDCDSLERLSFATGSMVHSIQRLAASCPKLKQVILPDSMQNVTRGTDSYLMVDCAALEQVVVYNPDLQLKESDFKNCGGFKVYGWGTEGNVLDFAEGSGHEFIPFAEFDDSGHNGIANVNASYGDNGVLKLEVAFSSKTGYDYGISLAQGSDYSLTQATQEGVTYWQAQGNNETSFGTMLIAVSQSISNAQISSIPTQLYSGGPCQPKPTVTLGGRVLSEGADYVLSYADNAQPGTATVTVTGMGGYVGSVSANFAVVSAFTVTQSDRTVTPEEMVVSAADTVVIAWGWDTAAVASASVFSAAAGYPLLCVSNTGLTDGQSSQLSAWGAKTAYVVGKSDDRGQTVLDQLQQAGVAYRQIAGQTDSEIALALKNCTQNWGNVAVVANPEYSALAVAAGAFAGAAGAPLVYTNSDGTLSDAALEALQPFAQVVIVGDEFQVDIFAQDQLRQAVRISGNRDASTSLALVSYAQSAGWYQAEPLYATSIADASTQAAWAAVAGKAKAPFVLVDENSCADIAIWAQSNEATVQGYVLLQNSRGSLDELASLLSAAN